LEIVIVYGVIATAGVWYMDYRQKKHLNKITYKLTDNNEMTELPNIIGGKTIIRLEKCTKLKKIPNIQNVTYIDIFDCQSVVEIEGSETVEELNVNFCNSLIRIGDMPNLKRFTGKLCGSLKKVPEMNPNIVDSYLICYGLPQITEISNVKNTQIIHIEYCASLRKIYNLENIFELDCFNNPELERIEQIMQSGEYYIDAIIVDKCPELVYNPNKGVFRTINKDCPKLVN
jgi:hypothetical protein